MTNLMQKRVIAFVRTIANECSICLRNGSERCESCIARRANYLLKDINNDEKPTPPVDYSFYARVNEIKRILINSERAMTAREIDLKHTCSPQLKFWTLNQMVQNGILGRKQGSKKNDCKFHNRKTMVFFYFIKHKETK